MLLAPGQYGKGKIVYMKVLLTNDDGFESPGLHVLGEVLSHIAEIYVVAPEEEKSGTGHGITVFQPIYSRRLDLPFAKASWAVAGLPADCVKLAMEELLPTRPDIIVSGINPGANMGNDILYSGTVSAALEGFLYGLPAIAISLAKKPGNTQAAAEFVRDTCLKWQAQGFKPRTLLNINVPGHIPEDIRGYRYTNKGWRWYTDVFSQNTDENGRDYYWMGGKQISGTADGNTDIEVCAAGYISITPLNDDLTNYSLLKQLLDKDILAE